MLEYRIRYGEPADIPFLVQFNQQMAQETEGKTLDPEILLRGVSRVFSEEGLGFYLVADDGKSVIGQLMVTREWSDWRDGHFWWIQSVYVPETARRHGVFRALFEEVKRLALEQRNVVGLRLYVEHENKKAQETYTRLGMDLTHYAMMELEF